MPGAELCHLMVRQTWPARPVETPKFVLSRQSYLLWRSACVAFWLWLRAVRSSVSRFFLFCLGRPTPETADFYLRQFSFFSAQVVSGLMTSIRLSFIGSFASAFSPFLRH